MSSKYKADFLWPYEESSVEVMGYGFANVKTKKYRQEMWNGLFRASKSSKVANDSASTNTKPKTVRCSMECTASGVSHLLVETPSLKRNL